MPVCKQKDHLRMLKILLLMSKFSKLRKNKKCKNVETGHYRVEDMEEAASHAT